MEKKVSQRVVIGAVIFNKSGKILILQRNSDETVYPDMWELPSGKREFLEESLVCLKREVKEEAGLDVEPIMPFSVFDYKIEKPDEIRDSTQINFLVSVLDENALKLSEEHQKSAWISEEEIENYNLTDSTKTTIKEAFKTSAKLGLK